MVTTHISSPLNSTIKGSRASEKEQI